MNTFGYLREHTNDAVLAGNDIDTGLCRTGLDKYLEVIFPDVHDWIHDKPLGGKDKLISRKRPDYRSESLKMIVEFDGIQHYQKLSQIEKDIKTTMAYEMLGYKVIRIPYFIQLTSEVVKRLFDVDVKNLFTNIDRYITFTENCNVLPIDMSMYGVLRMYEEFMKYSPEQLCANYNYLINKEKELNTNLGSIFLKKDFIDNLSALVYNIDVR